MVFNSHLSCNNHAIISIKISNNIKIVINDGRTIQVGRSASTKVKAYLVDLRNTEARVGEAKGKTLENGGK